MGDNLTHLIVSVPAFLLAIIIHEVAHGYVAYRLGDDTAKRAGRLTMSPLAHLDPIGTIFFIVSSFAGMGFGWAKPVPVVPSRLRNPRRDDMLVSLAGPVANLAQAAAWAILVRAAVVAVHATGNELAITVGRFCLIGVTINIVLMLFNLLPIPPLDGSHVAVRLLNVPDPHVVERAAPLGFIVLLVLLQTGVFDIIWGAVGMPIIGVLTGL